MTHKERLLTAINHEELEQDTTYGVHLVRSVASGGNNANRK